MTDDRASDGARERCTCGHAKKWHTYMGGQCHKCSCEVFEQEPTIEPQSQAPGSMYSGPKVWPRGKPTPQLQGDREGLVEEIEDMRNERRQHRVELALYREMGGPDFRREVEEELTRRLSLSAPAEATEPREGVCMVCGAEYPVWYATNELWNPVVRRPDGTDEWDFLCPTCFARIAVERGVDETFRLDAERWCGCGDRIEPEIASKCWVCDSLEGPQASERPAQGEAELAEGLELAWGVIANAAAFIPASISREWSDAAARWRERFLPGIEGRRALAARPPENQ